MTDLRKAAEMALERLESHEYWMDEKAIKALRQALVQPEQEPVAWRNTETGEFCTGGFLRKDLAKWMPLYTAPLKREWVGLTKEEFEQVVDGLEDLEDCWIQIESKLKEKNT